jgi:hypothetical protein
MKTLLVFLLLSLNLYSQNIDYLKSQDTVYIVFKEIRTPLGKTTTTKFENIKLDRYIDLTFYNYWFTSLDTTYQTIAITTRIANDNIVQVGKKKFLKEKSSNIVKVNFIDTTGLKDFFIDLLKVNRKSKVVYVIDEKSLKKRKIVMRKAFIVDIGFAEM